MPLQKIDIAVADITVRYNRTLYVDFTIPYTESGVGMIVPFKEDTKKNMWIFLKPLSTGMWFGSIIFFMYTGVVVWLLEYLNGNEHIHGPFSLRQLGITMFFSIFEESE
jgi:ionotropic glutamate receptor